MSAPAPVSFTIRRPTPVSRSESEASESDTPSFRAPTLPRHLTNSSTPRSPLARSSTSSPFPHTADDSSDSEDEEIQDELVTGFDQFGVQRLHEKKKKSTGPLVIPALKNRDWRELARKRRGEHYVPDSGLAKTGSDGSVGGLGTKDTINSGPQLSGLQVKQSRQPSQAGAEDDTGLISEPLSVETPTNADKETEDERARRLLIASATGTGQQDAAPIIPMISRTDSEADAYRQDVQELPDVATLDDYARVPVEQFGAALLRGMGWKEGTAASNRVGKDGKRKGIVEPYLPEARPALLGIGAKERAIEDDGSNRNRKGPVRPERRYVPVVKREREPSSRHRSRSRSPPPRKKDYSRDDDERGSKRRDRDRDRDYDSGKDRRKRDHDYDYDRERDNYDSRDRKRREYNSDRDRRRDYSPKRHSSRKD